MCIVSNIYDYGQTVPEKDWTIPAIREFDRLEEIARKLDQLLGQKDCEDPDKAAFREQLKAIEERLKSLEAKHE